MSPPNISTVVIVPVVIQLPTDNNAPKAIVYGKAFLNISELNTGLLRPTFIDAPAILRAPSLRITVTVPKLKRSNANVINPHSPTVGIGATSGGASLSPANNPVSGVDS